MKQNSHYTVGGIQPIEYMKQKMSKERYEGFCLGNVIKYTSRCEYKGTELNDLYKARDYLNWLIESLESNSLQSKKDKV
jgi:hypothetical protein